MLNSIAVYTTDTDNDHNRKTVELYEFLSNISPFPTTLNPSVKTVKNAYIFVNGYHRKLLNLDESNKIIFMCRKLIDKQWLLIPSTDVVVTNTLCEGLHISWQLQSKGFNKHVVHLLPWSVSKPITGKGIYYMAIDDRYKNAFLGRKLQNTSPNAPIRVYLSDSDLTWPYNIVEGMLNGAIPIAVDRPPFNELIINGHNGFLVRNPGDVVGALQKIDENKHWLIQNAKASINALLDPTRYLDSLMSLDELPGIKLNPAPVTYSKRKWLVRERTFQNGRVKYFPEHHSLDLTIINLNEVQEVLGYFLTQEFSEVYIFGCEIPENAEKREMLQLMRMIKKMGARSLRIHFCRDEPIPTAWEKIFARLSIISIEEGLKQVLG